MVPEPSARLLSDSIASIGLLRDADIIRKVMDAYVLNESYHEQLILAGGRFQSGAVPKDRPLVYMPSSGAPFVAKLNRARATVVDEAMEVLLPFLS